MPLLLPILVERFVSAEIKGSVMGTLRLVSLMLSLLVHAIAAQLSDRAQANWGVAGLYVAQLCAKRCFAGFGFDHQPYAW